MRYSVAWLLLLVFACGPSADEDVCLRDCEQWHNTCGAFCQGAGDCADDDPFPVFCDERCLVDEGGDPQDCAACFDCLEQNQSTRLDSGEMLDFCVLEQIDTVTFEVQPGFSVEATEPCFTTCNGCK